MGRKIMASLIGKQCGMTRIFTEDGVSHPVTVIDMSGGNRVVQVKTPEVDGYAAIQVTAGSKTAKHLTKPEAGHFAKANVAAGHVVQEVRLISGSELSDKVVGDELTVSLFTAGEKVDVTGITKGKGFAGCIKRWGFATQDATHGNSLSHRAPGSIGQCQTPGRVFPGKKMAGHLGNVKRTIQNLEVVRVDEERSLIIVKGGVPGAPGSYVTVSRSVKKKRAKEAR
jgi:large subunit ribosomal protein L3